MGRRRGLLGRLSEGLWEVAAVKFCSCPCNELDLGFAYSAETILSAQGILTSGLHFVFNFNITEWPQEAPLAVMDMG